MLPRYCHHHANPPFTSVFWFIYKADIHQDCAVAWATAGAAGIVLIGRNVETLNSTAEKIKAIAGSPTVLVQSTDVTSESSVKALYEKVGTQFKAVDVLINNAATFNYQNTGDTEPALWWHDFVSYRP